MVLRKYHRLHPQPYNQHYHHHSLPPPRPLTRPSPPPPHDHLLYNNSRSSFIIMSFLPFHFIFSEHP